MTQNTKMQKRLWDLFSSLKGNVGYYNLFSNVIHLVFLKYLISYSDRIENLDLESFKAISAFKRKYDAARSGIEPLHPEDVRDLFTVLESADILGNLNLSDSFRTYDSLFADPISQRAIIRILDEFDVEYNSDYLGDLFEFLIQQCSRDVSMTGESVTNKSLRQLTSRLLDVKKTDTLLNCFSGFSSLLLDIKGFARYIGYEKNQRSFLISKMMMMLLGVSGEGVFNQDFLLADTHECAEKVFSDGPINMRLDLVMANAPFVKEIDADASTRDGNLLILYKVLDSIKEGGTAVIAVPAKVLFSNNASYERLRKTYVENGLKAVVALPPLWSGTSINTNILVVKKGYKGLVEFVDAQKIGLCDKQKRYTLSEEDINRIIESINKNLDVDSFSKAVDYRDVIVRESWHPGKYIETSIKVNVKNLDDIDSELNSLYEELKNNLK